MIRLEYPDSKTRYEIEKAKWRELNSLRPNMESILLIYSNDYNDVLTLVKKEDRPDTWIIFLFSNIEDGTFTLPDTYGYTADSEGHYEFDDESKIVDFVKDATSYIEDKYAGSSKDDLARIMLARRMGLL